MQAPYGEPEIEHGDACDMVQIMLSIPRNTGWIEQSYSKLEMIFSKRSNG